MPPKIYLDHAAGSPLRPAARAKMLDILDATGNPSSVHAFGQRQRAYIDQARQQLADFFAARPEDVVFTSGATEANNLVLQGVMHKHPGKRLLTTTVEHDCVFRTAQALNATFIPVDTQGLIDLAALEHELAQGNVALVSVLHANNETGVIQPLAEIAALAHRHGALVHTDAVQSVGTLQLSLQNLGVDYLTFSGHKLGAPQGVGALILGAHGGKHLTPILHGGAQERGRRPGTENTAAIAALGAVMPELTPTAPKLNLAAELQSRLAPQFAAGRISLVAAAVPCVPHIAQLHLPGHRGEDVVIALDRQGIAVSQGAACSSGRVEPSRILQAMGWSPQKAAEGIRLSTGWTTIPADLDRAAAALAGLIG